jgi:hypothetical protein
MTLLKAARKFVRSKAVQLAVTAIPLTLAPLAVAGEIAIAHTHTTDGLFNAGTLPQTDGPEWSGPNVVKTFFPVAPDGSGGAYLYIDQGAGPQLGTLFLMYDYVNGNSSSVNTFFDVFFQDRVDNTDYGVRVQGTSFTAFEKPFGPASGLNPDGSFDFSSAPWTALTSNDLTLANFHGAVGFGTSPNDTVNSHLMAEFDLTINTAGSGTANGIYDPAPAFWSATCTNCAGKGVGAQGDPPITSGIFQLNPDGTTIVTPVLGLSGGPLQQPNESAPEPASLWLLAPALALLFHKRKVMLTRV